MKKLQLKINMIAVFGILFAAAVSAQEKTEITVQVKKDGKVVQDTTYSFDDADQAKHFMMVADAMSKDDMGDMHFSDDVHVSQNVWVESDGEKTVKKMVFIDEDGNTEIKEYHGDSLVWISEEHAHGAHGDCEHGHEEHIKIIHKELKDCEGGEGKTKVYVIKSEGDEGMKTIDILEEDDNIKVMKIQEDGELITIIESEDGSEKHVEVKVISSGDGSWTIESDEDEDIVVVKKEKVIVIEEEAPEKKERKSKKKE